MPLPHRVPDAITLEIHRISLKSCVYARVSGASGDSLSASDNKFCPSKTCIKIINLYTLILSKPS
ncbi:hypothetical protein [uncultured Helicobacter sp.]|uniref:hypothetical protein n=1 Tax=uncultured Helicobacter sp. TaxID=175537 RepID=UPI003753C1C5